MNFAIPFSNNFKYPDQNIQWNINYKPKIKELNDFIEKYSSYRINLIIGSDFDISRDSQIFLTLKEKFADTEIILCLPVYRKEIEDILNNKNIPHYYNEFIKDWDRFQGFLHLNVTDIFIAENLAFDIKKLSINAKKYQKKLRSFCNVCESSWDDTPSLKTFFIRPEDLSLYDGYIDTIEFYINNTSVNKINTLYEIYTKDKKWFGKLNEIIIGYKGEEDNKFIIPKFGEKRLDCTKRCIQEIEPTCHICDEIIKLGQTLKNKGIMVTVDK